MMNTAAFTLLMLATLLLQSGCKKSGTEADPAPFASYPLTTGNSWTYRSTFSITDFQPTRPGAIFRDTSITSTAVVTSTGKRTLLDSIETWGLRTTESDSISSRTMYHYYRTIADSLFLIAYSSGSIFTPKRIPTQHYFIVGKKRYASIGEIFGDLRYSSRSLREDSLSLIYEISPPKAFVFPMIVGRSWNYREAGHPFKIGHNVVAEGVTTTPAGTLPSFTIQWMWDLNADGVWDASITGFEYVAKEGLIKRDFTINNVIMTDGAGDTVGTVRVRDSFELTSLSLH